MSVMIAAVALACLLAPREPGRTPSPDPPRGARQQPERQGKSGEVRGKEVAATFATEHVELRGCFSLSFRGPKLRGGMSAAEFGEDGTLWSVTDRGQWTRLELGIEAGRLVRVSARLGRMKSTKGKNLSGVEPESLARMGADWIVAMEEKPSLYLYPAYGKKAPFAQVPQRIDLPKKMRKALTTKVGKENKGNAGMEAVTHLGPKRLLILQETNLATAATDRLPAWIGEKRGADWKWDTCSFRPAFEPVELRGRLRPKGICTLPDGRLLILERDRIKGQNIVRLSTTDKLPTPGSTIEPETLCILRSEAVKPAGFLIENFEGVAAMQHDGKTYFVLVSDESSSPTKKSYLMFFVLKSSAR